MSHLFASGNLVLPDKKSDRVSVSSSPETLTASRKRLGLSQRQLAEGLGVSVSTVQSWEQGRREPRTVALKFMELLFGKKSDSKPANKSTPRKPGKKTPSIYGKK